MIGTITRAQSGFFWVQLEETGETLRCTLRGRLKKTKQYTDIASLGDRVRVMPTMVGEGAVEEVFERRSKLARTAIKGAKFEQVLVANIDLILVTFAVARPAPHVRMIDRFLVVAEANHVQAAIIANKCDLAADEHARQIFGEYERIGYPVIYTSAKVQQGIHELRDLIKDKISVFSGPSGVGKSSLLNEVEPGLGLRTSDVSDAVNKGQHTTVAGELIPLSFGGFVADTPGIRELGLYQMEAAELEWCFREFRPFLGECGFANCTHDHEPECAIRDAVTRGEISPERHFSFVKLYQETLGK